MKRYTLCRKCLYHIFDVLAMVLIVWDIANCSQESQRKHVIGMHHPSDTLVNKQTNKQTNTAAYK